MDWREHIHSDEGILGGKPVIKGTRISVELILEFFEEGANVSEILEAYPHLTDRQVLAALAFARQLVTDDPAAARRLAA